MITFMFDDIFILELFTSDNNRVVLLLYYRAEINQNQIFFFSFFIHWCII